MDWKEITRYRVHIGVTLAVVLALGWYLYGYRPRHEVTLSLTARAEALGKERDDLTKAIADEERALKDMKAIPARVAPALANKMSPVDRLNYFLDNITRPANDLDLSYFTVTPLPPVSAATYLEI